MLNNFIYAKKKSLFTKELEAGNVLDEAIVFIEDTKEIWNHGTYFDCSTTDFDLVLSNYVDKTTALNYVDKTTELTISGLKTFTNHININNKSRIRSNIDSGEFKLTRVGDDKGFIIRVNKNGTDNILPLEILTTNGTDFYQYNFPKSSGTIPVGIKKNGQILTANLTEGLIDLGDDCLKVTYSNLKKLRDNGNLIPGLKYRITDYKTTAQSLSGISVADHSFNIIVEALTQNTLSENAKVANAYNALGTKQQTLFSWDMNPGNWQLTTNTEIQLLTNSTIYYLQGTRDINLAGVITVTFTPLVEDPETNDICIGADLVKDGSVISKDYHIGRINYDPYQADNNIYYLPVSEPGSYIIRYYVVGSDSEFETNLKVTVEAYDGINYFANNNLNAWEIKYSIDNDVNRFQWANIDPNNTKGVIYYMKDDHDNEAPYDFKNILFDGHYTFSYITSSGEIQDASVELTNCYANKIKSCYTTSNVLKLNKIVFKISNSSSICGYNEFGGNCENITFGDNCCSNKFGSYCKNNSFGDSCSYNTFADYCTNNSFVNFCQSNDFGVYCQNNSFDSYIIRITFGKQCINNKFTNSSSGSNLLEACRMIKFGDQCNGVNLYTTLEPSYSSGKWIQNITLSNALSGNIKVTELNSNRILFVTKNSNSSIVKYFESDFINKQDILVSGTNIKTINGESILGGGNITIENGIGDDVTITSSGTHTHTISADSTNTSSVSTSSHTHSVAKTNSTAATVASSTHTHTVTATGSVGSTFTGTSVTSDTSSATTSVATAAHTHSVTGIVAMGGASHSHSVSGTTGSAGSGVSISGSESNGVLTITVSGAGSHTHSVSFTSGSTTASHSHTLSSGTAFATADNTTNRVSVASNGHTHGVVAAGSIVSTFTGSSTATNSITGTTDVASSSHTHATTTDSTNVVSVSKANHAHAVSDDGEHTHTLD